jgi:hypothetical protein
MVAATRRIILAIFVPAAMSSTMVIRILGSPVNIGVGILTDVG